MKTKDIEPGGLYDVRLPEWLAGTPGGSSVIRARVLRAGFHYDVEVTTGSMIRGAPFKRTHRSEYANGVEVEWERQDVPSHNRYWRKRGIPETVHPGRGIVNASAVKRRIEEDE